MRNNTGILKLALAIFLIPTLSAAVGKVIYVDADATGANDGTSWQNAYICLQDGLATASSGDEIHMAEGIYKPDQHFVIGRFRRVVGSGDRTATFRLISGLAIEGGYAGFGEPDPDARDIRAYQTVLSGDLKGDDVQVGDPCDLGNEPSRADNSYHVVTASGTDATAILDGVTISAGNAGASDFPDQKGGGMYIESGSPTVMNCTFARNSALSGGAMTNEADSSPTVHSSTFIENSARNNGGAMAMFGSKPTLRDCIFIRNVALYAGGGIYGDGASPTVLSCTFTRNRTYYYGGGAIHVGYGDPILTNCAFTGNTAMSGGGMSTWFSNPCLTNCTLSGNHAENFGGGIWGGGQVNLTLTNCILWGNTDASGSTAPAQVDVQTGGAVDYCCIQGWTGALGGTRNHGLDPQFVDADGPDNLFGTEDDNLALSKGSPCINAGHSLALPPSVATDLAGHPRIVGAKVDMGAYEHQSLWIPETPIRSPRIIHVDDDANGANDGSSWENAYKCLQDALLVAIDGDEIWVAQGVYKPDRGIGVTPGDREATFQLANSVTLKGGYAGLGEPDPNARDHQLYATVLSGDLAANDVELSASHYWLGHPSSDENAYHVITCGSVDETTVLDGFTITGGNSLEHSSFPSSIYNSGAGMLSGGGSPSIITCTFKANSGFDGGALAMNGGSPTLVDCTFTCNISSWRGGGIYSNGASPAFARCTFNRNASDSGGAICAENGRLVLTNCTFTANMAGQGGGIFNSLGSYVHLTNCLFNGNSGSNGGAVCVSAGGAIIVNNTFCGNQAVRSGGGIYGEDDVNITLANCILWANTDSDGSGESAQVVGGYPVISYCTVQAWTGVFGGAGNHGADPLFVDADGTDNRLGTEDDNLRLRGGSPCIDSGDNSAVPPEVLSDLDGGPRFADDPRAADTGSGTPPIVDMGAYEGANQGFLVSTRSVEIVEGETAIFTIALAIDPLGPVEVTVAVESGDPDITIQSSCVLIFDSQDYSRPQTVVVAAAEDADYLRGSAMIAISAVGFATCRLSVSEKDTDTLDVAYVDARARGLNNGASWANAFVDLQEALQVAGENLGVKEVRVAQGVYCPAGPSGDRNTAFQLVNGVAVRGGYAGLGELDPDTRNIQRYETILSGDLNGNDVQVNDPCDLLGEPSRADNSFHVVIGHGTDLTAVLDGFTVVGGNARGARGGEKGGGIYNYWGSPTISNCTFTRNAARICGGAMCNWFSSPMLTNCVFRENSSSRNGGGMHNFESRPTLVNCVFVRNSAVGESSWNDSWGGGMYNEEAYPTLINCAFIGNAAEIGGGIHNFRRCSLKLINCVFTGNSALVGGGITSCNSDATLIHCTLVGNSADQGNALAFSCHDLDGPSHIDMTNCILWNGDDQLSFDSWGSTYSIAYSNVQGGWPGEGNIDVEPGFVDADGTDNLFGTEDDNPRLQAGSPCIDAGYNEADTDVNAPGVQPIVGVDADLNVRRFDDPATIDRGSGPAPIIDMGAYEFGSPPIPSVLYVNDDAEGANTGTSWEDAFTDLQTALETACVASGKVNQIWVAAGTYAPAPPEGDRAATFRLINGLAICGGFAGTENTLDQRDVAANVTILSGDLNNGDMPGRFGRTYANNDDNSYHVVTASYTDSTAILDGFTISGGKADLSDGLNDRGAGLYVVSGCPQIRNCVVAHNVASLGGGIWCKWASPTLIDCVITNNAAGQRGGGNYHYEASPVLERCTIRANSADRGAGVYCDRSNPSFVGCTFSGNQAQYGGGGYFGDGGEIYLKDCAFSNNWLDAASIVNAVVNIDGSVQMASNHLVGNDTRFQGDGVLSIQSDVALDLHDCRLLCDVLGPGTVRVTLDSELTIGADALVDLGHETDPNGLIVCEGLLRVKDNAVVSNAQVHVTRASFEDNAIIANCVINAEAGAPYGQFFIEDNVHIWLDRIEADGDRYLDLDPREFDCKNIHVGAIDVSITEGVGGSYGGLFELRGQELEVPACDPGQFFCQVDAAPEFGPNTWTIDRLELVPGAKLNLTNRFDFQAPYDSGGDEEVLYVKQLILGADSILNTAFNRLYYESLIRDPTAQVVNVPLLGFSLNNISFDDKNDFLTRVKHNNFEHPENPAYDRTHVERVEGLGPDFNGMMRMCNLVDLDPESPRYHYVVNARAKGLFAKSSEDVLLICFEYLFETSEPDVELVVYLTDVPELMEHGDPDRENHYILVARLGNPPAGRAGSAGSGRFGVFHQYVWTGDLDFVRGTRIELELSGPAGSCVLINNWDPQVHCNQLYCGDVTGDFGATVLDFLTVVAHVGSDAGLLPDGTNSLACLEFGFSEDGRIDTLDISAWDWRLNQSDPLNLCEVPLIPAMVGADTTSSMLGAASATNPLSSRGPGFPLDHLLVSGKRCTGGDPTQLLEDCLYVLDGQGQFAYAFDPQSNRTNGRLVEGLNGEVYQVNHEKGLIRLSDGTCVIPQATFQIDIEPRYGATAEVLVGLQERETDWIGRPILDATFDADGYVYVAPAVVNPGGREPYEAAAKLQLIDTENPPYTVVQLYDDPPPPGDNRYLDNLREIEIDPAGRLYVLNADSLNESDLLRVYDAETGAVKKRLELGNPSRDCHLPAPVAMHVSNTKDMLYLASSCNNPDANCASVYAFSANKLNLTRTVTIIGMGHITDITEDPVTGDIWVVGFTMWAIPDYIDLYGEPFYQPYLAKIPYGSDEAVEAIGLSDPVLYPDNDLALPLSILWTATDEERVNFLDFALFAAYWLESGCTSPDWCSGADLTRDGDVTAEDLREFCDNWLATIAP